MDTHGRKRKRNPTKEAAILQAAAELFTETDFHRVLMDEVASRAQVGKGTLYRYFPTKEDLYFATIFEGWDRLREELQEVLREEGTLEDALEKTAQQILSYFWQRRHFVTLVHRLEHNPKGKAQADWRNRREGIVGLVEGVLKRGVASGVVPAGNLRLFTEMFLGMLRAIVLYRGSRDTPVALARLAVQLFLHGIHGRTAQSGVQGVRTTSGGKTRASVAALL
jgi:AcrR family transcriptional regulator